MYEEIMKWVVPIVFWVAVYGGVLAIVQFLRKPYRKEIKAVDERVRQHIGETRTIQGDDWARMAKMDTRLTELISKARADINDIIATRIPSVVCDECGCLVKKSRAVAGVDEIRVNSRPLTTVEYFMTIADIMTGIPAGKAIYTPHYCRRCAGELKEKDAPKAKVKK